MDQTSLARADAQAQRHERELQALRKIARAIHSTMPIHEVMALAHGQIKTLIPAPQFCIALADPNTEALTCAFQVAGDERSFPDTPWPGNPALAEQVLKTGAAIRTENYSKECAILGIQPDSGPGEEAIHAWLGAPLHAGDRIVGVMAVYAQTPDVRYSEEDARFLAAVADHTAAAIENRRRQERLEAEADRLRTLNDICRLVASRLDSNEVLDLVVRGAARLLGAEASFLWLLDDDNGLNLRATFGTPDDPFAGAEGPGVTGIVDAVLRNNRPVMRNLTPDQIQSHGAIDHASGFAAPFMLTIPLNARGRTVGVLEVHRRAEKPSFSQEEADLLLAFGAQAAIAIENAHLFTVTDRALQARVEELTILQHIDRVLNASLDYAAVMAMTLEWAIRITGATVGLVAALQKAEDGSRGLQILAQHGYPPETMEATLGQDLWPLERGLIGAAVREGRTILVQDVHADARYVAIMPGMQAQLTLPMQRENRVMGVIALETADGDLFSPSAVDFVSRFAEHAAIAVDNARLFQQVQQANQAKSDFVSFVCHELKQPMTAIKGYADLLAKGLAGPMTDQQRQFLEIVRSNTQHMDRLVQDLLDISRLESGRLRLDRQRLDIGELISEALRGFDQMLREKQQTLTVEVQPDLPLLNGDHGRLIQVLNNLLQNAIAYTPEQGTIQVLADLTTIDGKPRVRVQVQDSGIGIMPEELDKLFTKYFRSSHPLVRSVRGTGLGLAITRSLVELHGGRISVESEPDQGSTFTVLLPVT